MVHKINNKTIDSNRKSIAEIIKIRESAVINDEILERRITLATECFTRKFPELILKAGSTQQGGATTFRNCGDLPTPSCTGGVFTSSGNENVHQHNTTILRETWNFSGN